MSSFILRRDDVLLQGLDTGQGNRSLVFQHGLGGSEAQVVENVPDHPGVRRITLDCRAQGASQPGSRRPFSIAMFAEDVLAAAEARGIDRFVAGGISMGAAIALRLAVRHPERVQALILARPAWTFDRAPPNMRPYAEVAELLRVHPPHEAKARFAASETARMLTREAPDNLTSLLGFFNRPDPAVTADLLGAIAADGPDVSRCDAAALRIPTLVIGHSVDHAHPLALAQDLARTVPHARLAEIPPKATQKAEHIAAFRAAVFGFLDDLTAAANASASPSPRASGEKVTDRPDEVASSAPLPSSAPSGHLLPAEAGRRDHPSHTSTPKA